MPEVAVEERARDRVGTVLAGKYRLDRLLGVGGMASVYAATHRNNKRLAVKVLHPELSIHADMRQRFMREGYVANTVDHPGAVAVLDDDVTEDGAAFLVMELLEGATLAELGERMGGTLPLQAVLAAGDQVLDVLAAADARGIVHRDIKPANLFLTTSGQVKVLDFGVARMRDVQGQHTTHSGVALGTPAFMAPEQAMGRSEDVGGRTDLWALGATMFALLTGRAVHQASSGQQQMVYAATRSAESLAAINPTTPQGVASIVDRSLAFHPHARWESAAAMRQALREAYQELYGEVPSPSALAPLVVHLAGGMSSAPGPLVSRAQRSPMAATFPATPVEGAAETQAVAKSSSASSKTPAVSLAGTMSQPRVTLASRARAVLGGAVLVSCGALYGAWAVARGHRAPSLPVAPSTGVVLSSSGPLPPVSAATVAAFSATGSASTAPAPSASAAASSSAASKLRSGGGGDVPSSRGKSVKPPPTEGSSSPPDRFDHQ